MPYTQEILTDWDNNVAQILDAHKKWVRKDKGGKRAHFEGIDFTAHGIKLDFHGVNLKGAVFRHCIIKEATFEKCALDKAEFTHCNLTGSVFRDSSMLHAKFDRSCLAKADMSFVVAYHCSFDKTDCREANFTLAACDFASFVFANLSNTCFSQAYLSHAKMKTAFAHYTDFTAARMHYADLSDTNLKGAKFPYAVLANANFSSADMVDADFKHADLSYAPVFTMAYGQHIYQVTRGFGGRNDCLTLYAEGPRTSWKWFVGCFSGYEGELIRSIKDKHGDTPQAQRYHMAIDYLASIALSNIEQEKLAEKEEEKEEA